MPTELERTWYVSAGSRAGKLIIALVVAACLLVAGVLVAKALGTGAASRCATPTCRVVPARHGTAH